MRLRGVAAAVAVTLMATACTADPAAPGGQPRDEVAEAVMEARAEVGDPMLALGGAVVALAEDMDEARHHARRGPEMRTALHRVEHRVEEVRQAVSAARTAAGHTRVEAAAGAVRHAAHRAEGAAAAAEEELAYLHDVNRVDRALLDVAAAWEQPGSQSEIRALLRDRQGRVSRIRRQARRLRPVPRGCDGMVANRRAWARVVGRRNRNLRAQAQGGDGETFDRLRAAYGPLPFAVEPRIADRVDRACWEARSDVAAAAGEMRSAVARLRRSLNG